VKATVEPLEGNRVKLSVEVEEQEFDQAVDSVLSRFAREARIPGFRPGKVPKKVLEAHLGPGVARNEALREALPDFYAQAVREHEVEPIAPPNIDITGGEDSGPVAFDAVVEIRPDIEISGYKDLTVTITSIEPTDEDLDAQVDRLRQQFGELSTADRPAIDGDRVTIDLTGSRDGEAVEGMSAEDYVYEVGTGTVIAELDDQLRGSKPGDILTFTAEDPGASHHEADEEHDHDHRPIDFRVLVKEVRQLVLPDLDDEFANEASEFETLVELRADLSERMTSVRRAQAAAEAHQKTAEAVAALVDIEVPESLVQAEVQQRLQDLLLRLQAQGIELGAYLQATGGSQEQLLDDLKATAEEAVRVDLALRAIADAEGIEVDDDDLEAEYAALAVRVDQTVDEVRQQLEHAEQVSAVRSDLRRRKAMELLLDEVEVVDEEGTSIDLAALQPPDDDVAQADEADDREDEEPQ
jgi:trigger factor